MIFDSQVEKESVYTFGLFIGWKEVCLFLSWLEWKEVAVDDKEGLFLSIQFSLLPPTILNLKYWIAWNSCSDDPVDSTVSVTFKSHSHFNWIMKAKGWIDVEI